MNDGDGIARSDANALRAEVVNWLLQFGEIDDLKPVAADHDLGALDRSRYERRLGLPSGSLSIGRFSGEFQSDTVEEIGERLLDEAYLGAVVRTPSEPEIAETDAVPATITRDPAERFARFLEAIDLAPAQVLMLSGSGDV